MKFRPKKRMSAADLMKQLQSDPDWVRENAGRVAHREAAAEQLRQEYRQEEIPLLAELANIGIKIDSIWDLVNAKSGYPSAIPTLTAYLQGVDHPRLREGIARALTVPEARGIAARVILEELQRPSGQSPPPVQWALANALTVVADESSVDTMRALIADDKYLDIRERLKAALKNAKSK
jgi:hypothetical protein